MGEQTVLLRMPDQLYARLKQRAGRAQRSLEVELLEVLTAAVDSPDELPDDLAAALAPLALLDDTALWRAAKSHLDARAAEELERLNAKHQSDGLSEPEEQRRRALLRHYERAMLVRAQAAALLKERDHDVGGLLAK